MYENREFREAALTAAQYELDEMIERRNHFPKDRQLDWYYDIHDAQIAGLRDFIQSLKTFGRVPNGATIERLTVANNGPAPERFIQVFYPIKDMQINQTLSAKCGREARNMAAAFSRYKAKHPGFDYVSQTQDDDIVRFWRIA